MVISIHAPREGSDTGSQRSSHSVRISIHAPREGSDMYSVLWSRLSGISIHAPREGSDQTRLCEHYDHQHFYPRSPRGERLSLALHDVVGLVISIHAPREGSDAIKRLCKMTRERFLSTLPARGATIVALAVDFFVQFLSTLPARGATACPGLRSLPPPHFYPRSPRGERPRPKLGSALSKHFYPRSPRGERLQMCFAPKIMFNGFLSTLPARGATANVLKNKRLSSAAFV